MAAYSVSSYINLFELQNGVQGCTSYKEQDPAVTRRSLAITCVDNLYLTHAAASGLSELFGTPCNAQS